MPVRVRDLARAAQRFEQGAAARQTDYVEGAVENTTWAPNTAAAAPAYNAGVQEAIAAGRFARGVQRAGQSAYQNGVRTRGAARYAQGIAGSGPAWQAGFAPYAQAIAAQTLPPRGPRRSQANVQRMLANLQTIVATAARVRGEPART